MAEEQLLLTVVDERHFRDVLLGIATLKSNEESQGEFFQGRRLNPVLVPTHCLPSDIPSIQNRRKTGFLRKSCFIYGIWFAIYLFSILKIFAERVENWCLEAKLEKIQRTNLEVFLAYSCRTYIPHFVTVLRIFSA